MKRFLLASLLLNFLIAVVHAANVSMLVTWKTNIPHYAAHGVAISVNVYSDAGVLLGTQTAPSVTLNTQSGIYTKTVTVSVDDACINNRVYLRIFPLSGASMNISRYSEFATAVPGGIFAPQFGTDGLTRTTAPTAESTPLIGEDLSVTGVIEFGFQVANPSQPGASFLYDDATTTATFELAKPVPQPEVSRWLWTGSTEDENVPAPFYPMELTGDGVLTLRGSDNTLSFAASTGQILFNGAPILDPNLSPDPTLPQVIHSTGGTLFQLPLSGFGWTWSAQGPDDEWGEPTSFSAMRLSKNGTLRVGEEWAGPSVSLLTDFQVLNGSTSYSVPAISFWNGDVGGVLSCDGQDLYWTYGIWAGSVSAGSVSAGSVSASSARIGYSYDNSHDQEGNTFIIGYHDIQQNQPRNALRVLESGVILVQPSGDLDMGSFKAGPRP